MKVTPNRPKTSMSPYRPKAGYNMLSDPVQPLSAIS